MKFTEDHLFVALAAFLITTTLIDIITALNSPIFWIAESNPIYLLFDGIFIMFSLSLIVTTYTLVKTKKTVSFAGIFLCTLFVIYLSAGHIFGTYTNIKAQMDFVEGYDYVFNAHAIPDEKQREIVMQQNVVALESFEKDFKRDVQKTTQLKWFFTTVGIVIFIPLMMSVGAFLVTLKFYNERRPKREQIIEQIQHLASQI